MIRVIFISTSLLAQVVLGFSSLSSNTCFSLCSKVKSKPNHEKIFTSTNLAPNSLRKRNTNTAFNHYLQKNHPINDRNALTATRGGYVASNTSEVKGFSNTLASFWAASGVVYILMKAVKRVLPIALEPFQQGAPSPLTSVQLGAYVATCIYFAYTEGYKGFQRKFAPLVVARSFTLQPSLSTLHHVVFAPFYAMGLFHSTRKRKIISWSVSIGVAGIVAAVKRLPYPWRNIVDAGVVVGLSWGSLSIIIAYIKGLMNGGVLDDVDPALP